MKKSLLALAVLGAFAGTAAAQSSVTLSGGVDVGVARIDDDYKMQTAGSGRSAITFSGREDLGGGMFAGFTLNHRFRPNTGEINVAGNTTSSATTAANSPQYFFRNAWVQLGGGFGDVRMGRMLMPLQEFNGNYEPFGTDTVGSTHTGGVKATVRATNTIYLRSASFGGLQLHAAMSAAEGQIGAECDSCTPLNKERPVGFGLKYDAGPISFAVANDKNSADQSTTGVYAKFAASFATFFFQYEKGDVPRTTLAGKTFDSVKRVSLGTTIPMGAAAIKLGGTNWSEEKKKKFGLGLDYNLSKRTQLYTNVGKRSGDGWSKLNQKAAFDVGVYHKF